MKKCPPGVFCMQNVTVLMIIIIILGLFGFLYLSNQQKTISSTTMIQKDYIGYPHLEDPYAPPLKDDRYVVPINVSTNIGAVDANYRQIGIITPLNSSSKDNILPLMGRPLFTNRGKWQYYTISNQHNNVKLPVSFKGKSALNDYGVDEIYNGDTLYVEGYNDAFKVSVYETNTMKYLPF
jgi:hypothetical protein